MRLKRRALIAAAFLALAAIFLPNRLHKALIEPPQPVCGIATRQRVVALTYDDGPHPVYTPRIMSILARYHARATFFMIGSRMARWPEIVKQAARQGDIIANHTYTHPNNLENLPRHRIMRELASDQRLIHTLVGRTYPLFRPPKGLLNRELALTAHMEGYTVILWSVSAYHHEARTPELMARRVLDRIRPGAIVLMHDGRYPMRWRDVQATPLIIEELRQRGYRFVTVPELLRMGATR